MENLSLPTHTAITNQKILQRDALLRELHELQIEIDAIEKVNEEKNLVLENVSRGLEALDIINMCSYELKI